MPRACECRSVRMAEGVFTLDLNRTFPRLSRPPIVEAVIHWQARAQKPLEPATLESTLAERLLQYATREPIQHEELMAMVSGKDASSVVQHRRGWQGVRLKSNDGRYVIQFRRDGLVFSQVKEYDHWESFADAAKKLWRE